MIPALLLLDEGTAGPTGPGAFLVEDGSALLLESGSALVLQAGASTPVPVPIPAGEWLLLEDGDALLLESGDVVEIELPFTPGDLLLLESGYLLLLESGDALLTEGVPYRPPREEMPGPLPDYAGVHVALGYYPPGTELSAWDSAEWDDVLALWEGDAPLRDISCDVLSVTWTQGRDQPLDRFRTGTCTVVVDDPTGALSPWATAPDAGAYATIRPGIDLVVWVELLDGSRIDRFTGIVDAIDDDWDPDPSLDGPHRVTFQALDYLQDLAAFDGYELPPSGAGETTGARLGRIVANAECRRPTNFDSGSVTVQETTLAKNALDEAGLVVDTERGAFWCDRSGVLQFRDRNGLVDDPRYTTVQAIFGERPGDGELCYATIGLATDQAKIRNVVTISRAGGTAVTRSDLDSRAMFGARTYQRLDLIHEDDAESAVIADQVVATFAFADSRVEKLGLDVVAHPDQLATILDLDVLDLIEVRRRSRGVQIVADLQVERISETITADAWTIDLATFSAATVFDVARWDSDLWDSGLWGY